MGIQADQDHIRPNFDDLIPGDHPLFPPGHPSEKPGFSRNHQRRDLTFPEIQLQIVNLPQLSAVRDADHVFGLQFGNLDHRAHLASGVYFKYMSPIGKMYAAPVRARPDKSLSGCRQNIRRGFFDSPPRGVETKNRLPVPRPTEANKSLRYISAFAEWPPFPNGRPEPGKCRSPPPPPSAFFPRKIAWIKSPFPGRSICSSLPGEQS